MTTTDAAENRTSKKPEEHEINKLFRALIKTGRERSASETRQAAVCPGQRRAQAVESSAD